MCFPKFLSVRYLKNRYSSDLGIAFELTLLFFVDSQSSGISDMKTLGRPPTIPSSPPPEISEHERTTPSMSSPLVPGEY